MYDCLPEYIYMFYVCIVLAEELELQTAVICLWVLGIESYLSQEQQVLLTADHLFNDPSPTFETGFCCVALAVLELAI